MTYELAGTILIFGVWLAAGTLMLQWTVRANWWVTVEGRCTFTLALALHLLAGSTWIVRAMGPYPGHRWVVFFAVSGIFAGLVWLNWLVWIANRPHRNGGR